MSLKFIIMKQIRFNLDDFTLPAEPYCEVSSQEQAEKSFQRKGVFGRVFLAKVTSVGAALNADVSLPNGRKLGAVKYLWICQNPVMEAFIPLFADETGLDEFYYDSIEPVVGTALIRKGQRVFAVMQGVNGKTIVRLLTVYFCQDFLETLYKIQGLKYRDTCLLKMIRAKDNQLVAYCWSTEIETVKDNGQKLYSQQLMPVSTFDSDSLYEVGLEHMYDEVVMEDELVNLHGTSYILRRDNRGKCILEKSTLQRLGQAVSQKQLQTENLKRKQAREQTAKAAPPVGHLKIVTNKKDGD